METVVATSVYCMNQKIAHNALHCIALQDVSINISRAKSPIGDGM